MAIAPIRCETSRSSVWNALPRHVAGNMPIGRRPHYAATPAVTRPPSPATPTRSVSANYIAFEPSATTVALRYEGMPADGFLSLLETHDHLDELFHLHQEALLVMRWPLAIDLFDAYRRLLTLHVAQEEERLLPLFQRAGTIAGAPVELFTGQHRKMFAQLDRIGALLDSIGQKAAPRRDAIEVLDHETAFKHLVEHHHGAEGKYFYPALEKIASTREVTELVLHCWQQWNLARDNLLPLVARAQREIDTP
jgi:hypothetical protein